MKSQGAVSNAGNSASQGINVEDFSFLRWFFSTCHGVLYFLINVMSPWAPGCPQGICHSEHEPPLPTGGWLPLALPLLPQPWPPCNTPAMPISVPRPTVWAEPRAPEIREGDDKSI